MTEETRVEFMPDEDEGGSNTVDGIEEGRKEGRVGKVYGRRRTGRGVSGIAPKERGMT